jgi:hypothetical protein
MATPNSVFATRPACGQVCVSDTLPAAASRRQSRRPLYSRTHHCGPSTSCRGEEGKIKPSSDLKRAQAAVCLSRRPNRHTAAEKDRSGQDGRPCVCILGLSGRSNSFFWLLLSPVNAPTRPTSLSAPPDTRRDPRATPTSLRIATRTEPQLIISPSSDRDSHKLPVLPATSTPSGKASSSFPDFCQHWCRCLAG